jgi:hypothetical protein
MYAQKGKKIGTLVYIRFTTNTFSQNTFTEYSAGTLLETNILYIKFSA